MPICCQLVALFNLVSERVSSFKGQILLGLYRKLDKKVLHLETRSTWFMKGLLMCGRRARHKSQGGHFYIIIKTGEATLRQGVRGASESSIITKRIEDPWNRPLQMFGQCFLEWLIYQILWDGVDVTVLVTMRWLNKRGFPLEDNSGNTHTEPTGANWTETKIMVPIIFCSRERYFISNTYWWRVVVLTFDGPRICI